MCTSHESILFLYDEYERSLSYTKYMTTWNGNMFLYANQSRHKIDNFSPPPPLNQLDKAKYATDVISIV